jgi:hypothetical protein
MKQGVLKGFGAAYIGHAKAPVDMPDDVVTMCRGLEAAAITHSINYAKRRFGYTQLDIAKLCGWASDNQLSAYKKNPDVRMPSHRRAVFAQVTGCNLLEQVRRRNEQQDELAGVLSPNKLNEAVVARMLEVA